MTMNQIHWWIKPIYRLFWAGIVGFLPLASGVCQDELSFRFQEAFPTGYHNKIGIATYIGNSGDTIFILPEIYFPSNGQLSIFYLSLANGDTGSFLLNNPDKITFNYGSDLAINGSGKGIILTHEKIYYIGKNASGNFNILNTIPNEESFTVVEPGPANNFTLEKFYNHHTKDQEIKVHLVVLNPERGVFESELLPNPDGVPMTNLIHQFISYSKNKVFITQTFEPKIRIYNRQLQNIDSIEWTPKIWTPIGKEGIPFSTSMDGENPKGVIMQISNFDEKISRIEKIFALSDSAILVIVKDPGRRTIAIRQLYLFRKSMGTWRAEIQGFPHKFNGFLTKRKNFILDFFSSENPMIIGNRLIKFDYFIKPKFGIPFFLYKATIRPKENEGGLFLQAAYVYSIE